MELFEKPRIEKVVFEADDILTTSPTTGDTDDDDDTTGAPSEE